MVKAKMLKDSNAPKRAMSAYFMWLNSERPRICKRLGTKAPTIVVKEAGRMWSELSDAKKTPWAKQAAKAKAKYVKAIDKYHKTAGYRKFIEAKKVHDKAAKRKNKMLSVCKEPDSKPKRSPSGYFLFLADNRDRVSNSLSSRFEGRELNVETIKQCGAEWSKLSDAQKDPFVRKAADLKAEYQEELAEYHESAEYLEWKEAKDTMAQNMKDQAKREKKAAKRKATEEAGGPPKKKAKKSKSKKKSAKKSKSARK